MPQPISASGNITFLGWCNQGGRPDGVQVMVDRGYAYVAHMESNGFTVVDVRDPRAPNALRFIACPPNTRSNHLQTAAGLLLAINGPDKAALKDWKQRTDGKSEAERAMADAPFAAGIRVFDLTQPGAPREIGFCATGGGGVHRIWWTGGRHAYASVHFTGYTDHILGIFDMADPARPRIVGKWALPGMHRAGGERSRAAPGKRWALHHMIVAGHFGFGAWRDGGFTIHDLSDPTEPKLLSHRLFTPPFGGSTHTPLPLPGRRLVVVSDEPTAAQCADGVARVWLFDVRDPANPISFATLPQPSEQDYCRLGGKFGAHNLHENRPGLLQSETLVFAAWNNAGLRIFDIADAFQPRQVGYCVPAAPTRLAVPQTAEPLITQSADVCVDRDGHMFITDNNGGLSILQFDGI